LDLRQGQLTFWGAKYDPATLGRTPWEPFSLSLAEASFQFFSFDTLASGSYIPRNLGPLAVAGLWSVMRENVLGAQAQG
jgi:hypothetical protein